MPDRPEPVGQDDFDQHVTPLVPDGTGVGHAMQGSLPPVEWEPVGQDAADPLARFKELVERLRRHPVCAVSLLVDDNEPCDCGISSVRLALLAEAERLIAEVRRLREERDEMLSVLRHLNHMAWGEDTMISGFRKWVAERTAP